MSDTSKTGRTLPEDIAAVSGLPSGAADSSLHAIGTRIDPPSLDPHAKAADFSLKPDPTASRDPIGRADHDPHARAAGGGPDLEGSARDARAAIGQVGDRAAELAADAKEKAASLADDVRSRLGGAADEARSRASGAYDDAQTWVSGVHREHMRRIDDAVVRGSEGLHRGRTAVEQFVTENPLLVGVVGVAAGLLLGALLPRTRQEDRNIGPYADEIRDQGLRYAREFTSRGRDFVETALDPDNIQAAAQKAAGASEPGHQGTDRTAHRL